MEAVIKFEEITFQDHPDTVRGLFLGRYYFDLDKTLLQEKIGKPAVKAGKIHFPVDQNHAEKRFNPLLDKAFDNLFHINYNKPTIYIHENTGIPLIGTNEFGIVDRGSNIIEIKPLTGCNFQCPYCSVDEGKNNKTHDYVVECEYLIQEAAKVAKIKKHPVEFHIGPQGEPMLYPKFVELVRGLNNIPNTKHVTVVTNGSLLTEKLIDELAAAGLTKINLSLNAASQETADAMSGKKYPLEHVKKMIQYCQGKINVILAPTIVPGWNDHEIEPLVQLGKGLKSEFPVMGLQNFLHYKKGRNVSHERSFDEFFEMIKPLEKKHGMKLTGFTKEDYQIFDDTKLEKPFKKNDIVKATIKLPARYPNETIAVYNDRCITVVGKGAEKLPMNKTVKLKIIRDKHNIFKGAL
ncbi:MAG: radical SAM protein [Candidatus Woesearchaeota archaeon]|nr:radical SAM protein [Candidatus Woesearchaeota archaeon]